MWRPAVSVASFICSSCATAPAPQSDFLLACWGDGLSGESVDFVRSGDGEVAGTIRVPASGASLPVIGLAIASDAQSIAVTSYPASSFVTVEQTLRLSRVTGYGHGLDFGPADAKISLWISPGGGRADTLKPDLLMIHVASLDGWHSDSYEAETIFSFSRTACLN